MHKGRLIKLVCVMMILTLFLSACSKSQAGVRMELTEESVGEITSESEAANETETDGKAEEADGRTEANGSKAEEPAEEDQEEKIFVHICGAIQSPGVYEIDSESRIFEVIELAGGLTKDADESAINQAEKLVDGQQIYIYTKKETEELGMQAAGSAADQNTGQTPGQGRTPGESTGETSGKVNLNTANQTELMSLSGIGEAKAKSIIDYRESHGRFETIEDIKKIDGIKDGVFNKIKNDITI